MKIKLLVTSVVAVVLSGCVGGPDLGAWKSSQKREFLEILKEDKYASLCDQKALYTQFQEKEDAELMSQLLVGYAKNLANSCIDIRRFKVAQQSRKARGIESNYELFLQPVRASDIVMKLKAGWSIERILQPYVPNYAQFFALIKSYHALQQDPTTNPKTLRKMRLSIERIKLMKRGLGEQYALVNIPEFKVRIIENNSTVVSMPVVVGKRHMQTPIFSADLQYITLNPQWSVPNSIARKEIIPKLLKNPDYLKRRNMVMRSDYNLGSRKLSPTDVDLKKYAWGKGAVPFKFIEIPSRRNGLGRVKFIFPNRHSVYMHDTQSKHLFKRRVRAYSHGCIRLSKPMEMLSYITQHYTQKSPSEVDRAYKSLKTTHIKLTRRLPVHTAYLTAYVDDANAVHLFDDIYGFDKVQKLTFR